MIVLKNLEIEESLIKPHFTTRKVHECAYCGDTILIYTKAIKASYRYDKHLYALYFHPECFSPFTKANINHD
jgi:hypothetical protein